MSNFHVNVLEVSHEDPAAIDRLIEVMMQPELNPVVEKFFMDSGSCALLWDVQDCRIDRQSLNSVNFTFASNFGAPFNIYGALKFFGYSGKFASFDPCIECQDDVFEPVFHQL